MIRAVGDSGAALRRRLVIATLFCLVVVAARDATSAPSTVATRSFARGGLSGSGTAGMTAMTLPARIARVAVVPGTKEAWALGFSTAALPGWDHDSPSGQVVFLHYTPARGWRMTGPPVDSRGAPAQPSLAALALAPNGEGWAVGDDGVLVHHRPGGGWVVSSQQPADATLLSVGLVGGPSGVTGYAVGDAGTVLRLAGGTWTRDATADAVASVMGELAAVSAVSAEEAWAVSSSSKDQLFVWHRTDQWRRVTLGRAMFDAPPSTSQGGGTVIRAARGAAVSATRFGAWVTGSILPVDASHPIEDRELGDASRPFAVWIPRSETGIVTYCPLQYGVNPEGSSETSQGAVDVERLCDQPMPVGAFDLASVSALPTGDAERGGEAFAGGLGLYHFRNGGWWREPDPVGYIVSTSFSSPTEGWVASSGNTFGATGLAYSSTAVVGHWSSQPADARTAAWGLPTTQILESVARGPGGRLIAVGQSEASVVQAADGPLEHVRIATDQSMHAVAWPGETAWAVGNQGTIARFDGERWSFDPASTELTRQPLFALAFRSAEDGVAVGGDGTILRYDGSRWRRDAQSGRLTEESLYAVTTTASGYAAAGAGGTILFERAGRWRADRSIEKAYPDASDRPDLYAVAATAGDRIVAGGQRSALLSGREGAVAPFPAPVEGTIVALAAPAGESSLLASVTEEQQKYLGSELAVTTTALMSYDGSRWRDVQMNARRTLFPAMETGGVADPIFSIAAEAPGRAWGVGGVVPNTLTPNASIQSTPTSSLYRIDLHGDPRQPNAEGKPLLPESGVSFAFFGETGCARGLCSLPVGSGIRADVVPLQIRREINALSGPGGIAFTVFGGNMRQTGVPEELAQFKGYLRGFDAPIFATVGDEDLFVPSVDGAPAAANQRLQQISPDANRFWLDAFADEPAPWGTLAGARPGIVPVADQQPATVGKARTHYAFDFVEQGRALVRVAVVDTSRRQISGSQGQNPPDEQMSWLGSVLEAARDSGIPAIVLTNQPTLRPVNGVDTPNWPASDIANFYRTLVLNGVPGAISSGIRDSSVYGFSVATPDGQTVSAPFFVSGGAGAPLAGADDPESSTSFHGWLLVTIDESRSIGPFDAPIMSVRTVPVLESLSMWAAEGRRAKAGATLSFAGLGRAVGGGSSNPAQSRASYVTFPQSSGCWPVGNSCFRPGPLRPDYRFWSEDPEIADFVALGPAGLTRTPSGEFAKDSQSGILCTFKPGTTHVNLQAGFRRARVPVHVAPGTGVCQEKLVPLPRPKPTVEPDRVVPPVEVERAAPQTFRSSQGDLAIVIPPPPAPVVAPAPPGAPGVGRKEEHEHSLETEGHGGEGGGVKKHAFVRREEPAAVPQGWPLMGGVIMMAFAGACAAAAVSRKAPGYQRARAKRDD